MVDVWPKAASHFLFWLLKYIKYYTNAQKPFKIQRNSYINIPYILPYIHPIANKKYFGPARYKFLILGASFQSPGFEKYGPD